MGEGFSLSLKFVIGKLDTKVNEEDNRITLSTSPALALQMVFKKNFSTIYMVALSITSLPKTLCAHGRNMAPLIEGLKKGELISNIEILLWGEEDR